MHGEKEEALASTSAAAAARYSTPVFSPDLDFSSMFFSLREIIGRLHP
jgi:hypothetical protein